MSTFSLFGTASSGLAAARAALEVTGQNVANVGTAGYTRQRVDQVSLAGTATTVLGTTGLDVGQGTKITGISRLADALVDARVRDTASSSGYWTAASAALTTVESTLGEPGDTGLSKSLSGFWSAWQTMGNHPGDAGSAGALIGAAKTLTGRIAAGYDAASSAWTAARTGVEGTVGTVNRTLAQVAALNQQILKVTGSGGNPNELADQRSLALTALSSLAGTTTRQNPDGSMDVLLGGSTVVSGFTAKTLTLTGSTSLESVAASPLSLSAGGSALQVEGGALAAQLGALGPTGAYAQAADAFNGVATGLATAVNDAHQAGSTPGGTTGTSFFAVAPGVPPARALTVVPTSAAGIATGRTGAGGRDGSNADAISGIGSRPDGPDAAWSAYVSGMGALTRAASTQAGVASSAATAATSAQTSQSGVDLDEETANLVIFQHAYQGAARVMTAIDEMLDTLINRTGLVGR